MRVKFLRDFQGANTAEQFYERGAVVELREDLAAGVIAEGAAVLVAVSTPSTAPVSAPAAAPDAAGDAPAKFTLVVPEHSSQDANSNPAQEVTPPVAAKKTAKRASKKAAKP